MFAHLVRTRRVRQFEPVRQTLQRHVLRNHIMRDKKVLPRLSPVLGCVLARVFTPRNGNVALGKDLRIVDLVFGFRLHHVNRVVRLGNEVRLILGNQGFPASDAAGAARSIDQR